MSLCYLINIQGNKLMEILFDVIDSLQPLADLILLEFWMEILIDKWF